MFSRILMSSKTTWIDIVYDYTSSINWAKYGEKTLLLTLKLFTKKKKEKKEKKEFGCGTRRATYVYEWRRAKNGEKWCWCYTPNLQCSIFNSKNALYYPSHKHSSSPLCFTNVLSVNFILFYS